MPADAVIPPPVDSIPIDLAERYRLLVGLGGGGSIEAEIIRRCHAAEQSLHDERQRREAAEVAASDLVDSHTRTIQSWHIVEDRLRERIAELEARAAPACGKLQDGCGACIAAVRSIRVVKPGGKKGKVKP